MSVSSGAIGLTGSVFSSELPKVASGFYNITCSGSETNLGSCLFQLSASSISQCETASVVCQGRLGIFELSASSISQCDTASVVCQHTLGIEHNDKETKLAPYVPYFLLYLPH